ncbi:hypothetical protein JCM16138_12350 [Thermococcus atlanticus]
MGGEELRFTGNWFIDAGILGFVNLMEEVYGWDLEELQRRIKEEPEKVYYGYFPLAYIFRRSVISGIYRQQKDLRGLIGKSLEKKKRILENIKKAEDKKKELQSKAKKSSKTNKELQKTEERIISLKKQINEIEGFIDKLNKHILLLDNALSKLKREFKRRVEEIVEDYDEFDRQYSDCFKDSDWVYTVIPLDKTAELNKRLKGVLLQGAELKLLTVTEKKDETGNILKRLPSLGNFVIHPNANERNFYLYNPRKEDEYTALLYTIALLREDVEKIKLMLGMKYNQDNPRLLRLKLLKFLELCELNNVEPTKIVTDIENTLNEGIPKKKAVSTVLKRYKLGTHEELAEILSEVYKNFKDLINRRGTLITYEVIPDSTINPFLFSPTEFSNLSYTSLPKVNDLRKLLPKAFSPYILFLVFFDAFIPIQGKRTMFYTPELNSCHSINKRIRTKIQLARENNHWDLLKITWSAILDELIELKSRLALENMYLIEANVGQNKLEHVEYIGIPKLHASIILDDQIRDAMNTSIPIGDSRVWLLGEFIKQKPLYTLISKHVWNAVKGNGFFNWKASLYALAIDAKLRKEGTSKALFDRAFLDRPKRASLEVKDFYRDMAHVAVVLKELSREINGKNLIHPLFSALRRHNRNAFVNILLKSLLQAKSKDKVATVNNYIFRRLLNNDESWEDFALALIVGLAGGGEDVGSGQDVVAD